MLRSAPHMPCCAMGAQVLDAMGARLFDVDPSSTVYMRSLVIANMWLSHVDPVSMGGCWGRALVAYALSDSHGRSLPHGYIQGNDVTVFTDPLLIRWVARP